MATISFNLILFAATVSYMHAMGIFWVYLYTILGIWVYLYNCRCASALSYHVFIRYWQISCISVTNGWPFHGSCNKAIEIERPSGRSRSIVHKSWLVFHFFVRPRFWLLLFFRFISFHSFFFLIIHTLISIACTIFNFFKTICIGFADLHFMQLTFIRYICFASIVINHSGQCLSGRMWELQLTENNRKIAYDCHTPI